MNKSIYFIFVSFIISISVQAQEEISFMASVNNDTILLGSYFELTFTLTNSSANDFQPPSFDEFSIISGPNQSSNFSMMNGEIEQSFSISYYLQPESPGQYTVQPATVETKDGQYVTDPIEITVVDDPSLINNQAKEKNTPIKRKSTKKRKRYKI